MSTQASNILSGLIIQCCITEDSPERVIIFSDFFFFIFKEYFYTKITLDFTIEPLLPFFVVMSIIRTVHVANNRKEIRLEVPHSVCGCENPAFDRCGEMAHMARMRTDSFEDRIPFGFTKAS